MHEGNLIQEITASDHASYNSRRSIYQRVFHGGFLGNRKSHSWKSNILQLHHRNKQAHKAYAFPARRGNRQNDEMLELLGRFRNRI